MPIFSYICKDCGNNFDLLIGVTKERDELKCNKCKSAKIEKVFSTFGVRVSKEKDMGCPQRQACTKPTCPMGG